MRKDKEFHLLRLYKGQAPHLALRRSVYIKRMSVYRHTKTSYFHILEVAHTIGDTFVKFVMDEHVD